MTEDAGTKQVQRPGFIHSCRNSYVVIYIIACAHNTIFGLENAGEETTSDAMTDVW